MTPRPALSDYFRGAMKPPPDDPIWLWAEKSIYLSSRQATANPGHYSADITPYVRGIFDALQDDEVREVIVEKGAQTGATFLGYVWLCWMAQNDAGPAILIYPSESLARSASETRMMPLIEDSPALRELLPEDRDEYTKLQYRLTSCTINWVGSNSPANLASRPARYLFCDEVDKYPANNKREATPLALAKQRTKTFWNRKIFEASTPTTPDGQIHTDYLAGDQRRYFVPCHKCGAMQFLKWAQVKWDENKPSTAHYECEVCGEPWDDVQKNLAVGQGEWRATTTAKEDGRVSFHLSSLYSTWTKFPALASRFLQVKDFPGELQDFINSELGEPFERVTVHLRDGVIAEREGQYKQGQNFAEVELYLPTYKDMDVATFVGVDVQKTHLVCCARQFAKNGDSGLIKHQNLSGFQALNEYANEVNAHSVFVDSGYRTQEVYEASLAYKFVPTKGSSFRIPGVWEQTTRNIDEGTRRAKQGRMVGIILFDPNQMKDQLFERIDGSAPFAWLVPQGTAMDASYCTQMAGEARDDKGKWKPVKPNATVDFWDAEVLCLLGATVYGYNQYIMPEETE